MWGSPCRYPTVTRTPPHCSGSRSLLPGWITGIAVEPVDISLEATGDPAENMQDERCGGICIIGEGGFVDVSGSTVDVSGNVDVTGSSVYVSGSFSVD